MRKILLFGTGAYGRDAFNYIGKDNILFWVDNNNSLWGKELEGIQVISPDKIVGYLKNTIIIVAVKDEYFKQIKYQLKINYNIDKIINFLQFKQYLENEGITVCNFLSKDNIELDIYKIMLQYAEITEQTILEKLEFFVHNADITKLKQATGRLRARQIILLNMAKKISDELEKVNLPLILAAGNLIGAVRNGGFIPWDDDFDFCMLRCDYNNMIDLFSNKGMYYCAKNVTVDGIALYHEMKNKLKKENLEYLICGIGRFTKVCFLYDNELYDLDIFPLDYYNNSLKFCDLLEKDRSMGEEFDKTGITSAFERTKWYNDKIAEDLDVGNASSDNICYGLETGFIKTCHKFISSKSFLPLKKIKFEGVEFFAPQCPLDILDMEHGDIYEWPSDAGLSPHCIGTHYHTVDNTINSFFISSIDDVRFYLDNFMEDNKQTIPIIEKYKIKSWNKYFEITDMLKESEIEYIVYA